jgi:carbon starvation protein
MKPLRAVAWLAIALLGAAALGVIATTRGEPLSSTWFLIAALASYAIGYRFYSAFLAARALSLDDARATPAHRLHDG